MAEPQNLLEQLAGLGQDEPATAEPQNLLEQLAGPGQAAPADVSSPYGGIFEARAGQMRQNITKGTAAAPADEPQFQAWYAHHAKTLGLSPNPDDVEHYYDWRAAYRAGATPNAEGHWPSQFKRAGHPNLVVNGVDTRTGQPAEASVDPMSGMAMAGQDPAQAKLAQAITAGVVNNSFAGRTLTALLRHSGIADVPDFNPEDPGWPEAVAGAIARAGVDLPTIMASAAGSTAVATTMGAGKLAASLAGWFGSLALPSGAAKLAETGSPSEAGIEAVKEGLIGLAGGTIGKTLGATARLIKPDSVVPPAVAEYLGQVAGLGTAQGIAEGRDLTLGEWATLLGSQALLAAVIHVGAGGKLSPADVKGLEAKGVDRAKLERLLNGPSLTERFTDWATGKQEPGAVPPAPAEPAPAYPAPTAPSGIEPQYYAGLIDAAAAGRMDTATAGRNLAEMLGRPATRAEQDQFLQDVQRKRGGATAGVPQPAPTPTPGRPPLLAERPTSIELPEAPPKEPVPQGRMTPPLLPDSRPFSPGPSPSPGAPIPPKPAAPAMPAPEAAPAPAEPRSAPPTAAPHQDIQPAIQEVQEAAGGRGEAFAALGDLDARSPLNTAMNVLSQAASAGTSADQALAGRTVTQTAKDFVKALDVTREVPGATGALLDNYLRVAEAARDNNVPATIADVLAQAIALTEAAHATAQGSSTAPHPAPGRRPAPGRPAVGGAAPASAENPVSPAPGGTGRPQRVESPPAGHRGPVGGHGGRGAPVPPTAIERAGGGPAIEHAAPQPARATGHPAEHPAAGGHGRPAEAGRPERQPEPAGGRHGAEPAAPTGPLSPEQKAAIAERTRQRIAARAAAGQAPTAEGTRIPSSTRAEAPEHPHLEGEPAKAVHPEILSPLYTLGRHLHVEHPERGAWESAMRHLVPEVEPHYLDHVWSMLPHKGTVKGEHHGEPGPAPAGREGHPEPGVRPAAEPGGAGGGGDRRAHPRQRKLVRARAQYTHEGPVERTPGDLLHALSPEQQQGAEQAIRAMQSGEGGFLLADGTGAGKTAQILAVAEFWKRAGRPVLIVAPAEVLKIRGGKPTGSYADDAARMGVPLPTLWKTGPLAPGTISLVTYNKFQDLTPTTNLVAIFDEAHQMKNEGKSRRADVGVRMAAMAHAVLFATATPADKAEQIIYLQRIGILEGKPVAQALQDLGMILRQIRIVPKTGQPFTKQVWAENSNLGHETIAHRFEGLFDRMTDQGRMLKREVSMDGMDVAFRRIPLPPAAYETMAKIEAAFGGLDQATGLSKALILMHQRRQQEPYKIPLVADLAREEVDAGRSVVLFVSRVSYSEVAIKRRNLFGDIEREVIHASEGTAGLLKEALVDRGIPTSEIAELHGAADERGQEAMARFQDGRAKVIIATVESGGTGINLDDRTGEAPRTMIVVTAPFSGVDNVQAAGRINRMTTRSDSKLVYLHSDLSPDLWNLAIVAEKMRLLGATVSGSVTKLEQKNARAEAPVRDSLETPYGQPREYSSVQVDLARDLADEIRAYTESIDPTLQTEAAPAPHVTVRYGLETEDPNIIRATVGAAGPVRLTLGATDVFEEPEHDVLIVKVDSPDLTALHRDFQGLRGIDAHPTYVPHVTVAYLKKGEGARFAGDERFSGRQMVTGVVSFRPKNGNKPVPVPLVSYTPTILESPRRAWLPRANPEGETLDRLDDELQGFLNQVRAEAGPGVTFNASLTLAGEIFVFDLAVPPAQQGRGTGTRMMQALADWADARNLQISLNQAPQDRKKTALRRFYRDLGFRRNGTGRFYDPRAGGAWVRPSVSERGEAGAGLESPQEPDLGPAVEVGTVIRYRKSGKLYRVDSVRLPDYIHYSGLTDPRGHGVVRSLADFHVKFDIVGPEPLTSAMKVTKNGETRAVAGMDPRLMGVLGQNLYSGDLGKVAVKEAIQNARDSLMALEDPSRGKLRIDIDSANRSIIIEDTGVGMLPAVAVKELVDIGGSYKPGQNAAGGFGIAKVAIFANAEKIEVSTTARDRDGRLITTRLTGSGEEWADASRGLKVESNEVETGPLRRALNVARELAGLGPETGAVGRTGTLLHLILKPDVEFSSWRVKGWLQTFAAVSQVVFPVEITVDGDRIAMRNMLGSESMPRLVTRRTPAGAFTFYASTTAVETRYVDVHVLNRGIYQFDASTGVPTAVKLPDTIVVDIAAKGDPEGKNYPFRPDREGLRDEGLIPIRDFVSKELFRVAAAAEMAALKAAVRTAARVAGGRFRVIDTMGLDSNLENAPSGATWTQWLASRSYLPKLLTLSAIGFRDMGRALVRYDSRYTKGRFLGLGTGKDYLGISISGEGLYGVEKTNQNIVLINPYIMLYEFQQHVEMGRQQPEDGPLFLANAIADTLLHELVHQPHRGHGVEFAGGLTRAIGPTRPSANRTARRLYRYLTENTNASYNALVADYESRLKSEWAQRQKHNLFGKISDDAAAEGGFTTLPPGPAGGAGDGTRRQESLPAGRAGAPAGLAGGAELRAGDGAGQSPGEPALGAAAADLGRHGAGEPEPDTAGAREAQPQPAGQRTAGGLAATATGGGAERPQPGPGPAQDRAGLGPSARPGLAAPVPGGGPGAPGGAATAAGSRPGGAGGPDFVELPTDLTTALESPLAAELEGRGAHGLGKDYLLKVPWRLRPGTRARLLQETAPANAERQEAEYRAILARNPNAMTSRKAWMRMQFEAFGDTLLPLDPIVALGYVERPGRLARHLLRLPDTSIANTLAGLKLAQTLGEAYRSGAAPEATTALIVLWSMLSRQKTPYFQEAGFLDAIHNDVEAHVEAALDGRFTPQYLRREYLPWARTAFPDLSPGGATFNNLNSFGRTFLYRMAQSRNGIVPLRAFHALLADPGLTSQEVALGFWRVAPPGTGVDDKLLKFMALATGHTDAIVLDVQQVNHLWGAGLHRRPDNLYQGVPRNPGLVGVLRGHRGLLLYGALESGLSRILPDVFGRVNERLAQAGRPALTAEPSLGLLHWLTWNLASGQDAGHQTLEGLRNYAVGSPAPFAGIFAQQSKFDTFKQGARYGYTERSQEPVVRYVGPDGRLLEFTPEGFEAAVESAAKPRNRVVSKPFRVTAHRGGHGTPGPFWTRPGVDPVAWQRLLDDYGIPVEADQPHPDAQGPAADDAGLAVAEPPAAPAEAPADTDLEGQTIPEPAPVFYSRIRRWLEAKLPERALPAQVTAILKAPGVRPDDVKWSGLLPWLASLPAGQKLDKTAVLDNFDRRRVTISEKLLGPVEPQREPDEDDRRPTQTLTAQRKAARATLEAVYDEVNQALQAAVAEGGLVLRQEPHGNYGAFPYKADKPGLWGPRGANTTTYRGDEQITDRAVLDGLRWAQIQTIRLASPLISYRSFDISYTVRGAGPEVHWLNIAGHAFESITDPARKDLPSLLHLKSLVAPLAAAGQALLDLYKTRRVLVHAPNAVQYAKYKLAGGGAYRELLFHLVPPEDGVEEDRERMNAIDDAVAAWKAQMRERYGPTDLAQASMEEWDRLGVSAADRAEWSRLAEERQWIRTAWMYNSKAREINYRAPHFHSEAHRLLAHVRFTEREGPPQDSKTKRPTRILFIEEVQSDWLQAIRDAGGARPIGAEREALEAEMSELRDQHRLLEEQMGDLNAEGHRVAGSGTDWARALGWVQRAPNEPLQLDRPVLVTATSPDSLERVMALARQHEALRQQANALMARIEPLNARHQGPPDAPLQKGWEEMLLRRMIHWAAAHGFDAVAWTTSRQQAERYNRAVAEHVSQIDWRRYPDGTYYVQAGAVSRSGQSPAQLRELLGATIAERIEAGVGGHPVPPPPAPLTELPPGWRIERERIGLSPATPRLAAARHPFLIAFNEAGTQEGTYSLGNTPDEREVPVQMAEFRARILERLSAQAMEAWGAANQITWSGATDTLPVAVGSLTGLDMEIGGNTGTGFYDKKLVNVANDVLKPWGVRVQPVQVRLTQGTAASHQREYRGPDWTWNEMNQPPGARNLQRLVEELGGQIVRTVPRAGEARREMEGNEARISDTRLIRWREGEDWTAENLPPWGLDLGWRSLQVIKYARDRLAEVIRATLREEPFQETMTRMNREWGMGGRLPRYNYNQRGVAALNHRLGGKFVAPTEAEIGTQHGFPITAAMKKSVLEEGQPLLANAQTDLLGESPPRRGVLPVKPAPLGPVTASERALARQAVESLMAGVPLDQILGSLSTAEIASTTMPDGSVKLLGLGTIGKLLLEQRALALEGLPVDNARDLARLGQLLRNPFFETAWRVYVKDGRIVGVQASSMRLPGRSDFRMPEEIDGAAAHTAVRERMAALGADGYYLLHNHPTGDPRPSDADLSTTQAFARGAPGFRGHVIVDTNSYALIPPEQASLGTFGRAEIRTLAYPDLYADPLLTPAVPNPFLGKSLESLQQLAAVGFALKQPGLVIVYRNAGSSRQVGTSGTMVARAIEAVRFEDAVREPEAFIRHLNQRLFDFGAADILIYADRPPDPATLQDLQEIHRRTPPLRAIVFGPGARTGTPIKGAFKPTAPLTTVQSPANAELPEEPSEEALVADLRQLGQFVWDDGARDFPDWKDRLLDLVGDGGALPYLGRLWKEIAGQDLPLADEAELRLPGRARRGTPAAVGAAPARVDLVRKLQQAVGIPVRTGRLGKGRNVLGLFKFKPEVIRTQIAHDLQTLPHEVGHYVSKLVWGDPAGLANLARATFYGTHRTELMRLAAVHARPSEEEGFAEFWRHYLTNPAALTADAPGLLAAVPPLLEAKDPDLLAALHGWRDSYQAWNSQSPADVIKAHIVWDVEHERPAGRPTLERLYEEMIYDLAPLDRAVQDLKRRSGWAHLPADKDPSVLAQTLAGMPEAIKFFLFELGGNGGALDFDTRRAVGPSLERVLAPVGERLKDWETYMVARRMQEIFARVDPRARRQAAALQRALNRTPADIDAAVRQLETPAFRTAHDQFQAWNEQVLKYVRDAGMLTPEAYDRIRDLNRSYFPFYRFFADEGPMEASVPSGGGLANVGNPVKGMKGSGQPFKHPLATAVRNLYTFVMRAERHHLAQALVDLAESTPGGGAWVERIPTMKTVTPVMLGELRQALEAAGVPTDILDQADLSQIALIFRPDLFRTGDNEIWVLRHGKPVHYAVDPDLYRALMLLDRSAKTWLDYLARGSAPMRAVAKVMTKPKEWLTAGATLALEFAARNPIRDVMTRALFSAAPSKVPLPIIGPWIDLFDAMFGTARGAISVVRRDQWFQALRRSGGMIAGLADVSGPELQRHLEDVVRGRDGTGWRTITANPVSWLRFLSNASEQATRVAEFRDVLQARGVGPLTASKADLLAAGQASRDTTGDWNRSGSMTRRLALNRIIAFYNPSWVGLDKFGRTLGNAGTGGGGGQPPLRPGHGMGALFPEGFHKAFGRGPGDYRWFRFVLAAMSTITALSVLLWWRNHDDPRWAEIPMWQKNIAWIWLSGTISPDQYQRMSDEQRAAFNRQTITRIPKPFEVGIAFGSVPERVLDFMVGVDPSLLDSIGQALGTVVGQLNPLPNAWTTFGPIFENYANWQGYFDRPIEPGQVHDLEPVERTGLGVSKTAELIAGAFDKLNTGARAGLGLESQPVPEMLRSPYQVDHMLYGYFAGQGRALSGLADAVVHRYQEMTQGVPPPMERSLADWPGIRGFVVRYPTTSARSIQDFWTTYNRLSQVTKTAQSLEKTADEATYARYVEAHAFELTAFAGLSEVAKDFAGRRARQRQLITGRGAEEMTPAERRGESDGLTLGMIETAQEVLADLRSLERANRAAEE